MTILRLSAALLAASTCAWAGYQLTYSDPLTSVDPSKWSQNGVLSAGSNGVTGAGSLISSVTVPTGNDYDVRMTIHTASQGSCAAGSGEVSGRNRAACPTRGDQ